MGLPLYFLKVPIILLQTLSTLLAHLMIIKKHDLDF